MRHPARFPLVHLAIVAALFVLVVPVAAHAQPSEPSPLLVAALTPFTVTVALLTLLVSGLTSIKNAGEVLGKPLSPTATTLLTIVAPFFTQATGVLVQAGSLSTLSLFNALVVGAGTVIVGVTTPFAYHAHVTLPKLAAAMRRPPANDNSNAVATKPAA